MENQPAREQPTRGTLRFGRNKRGYEFPGPKQSFEEGVPKLELGNEINGIKFVLCASSIVKDMLHRNFNAALHNNASSSVLYERPASDQPSLHF